MPEHASAHNHNASKIYQIPKYLQQFPEQASLVVSIVEKMKSCVRGNEGTAFSNSFVDELEFRLGSFTTSGQKENGISEQLFYHILDLLKKCGDWTSIVPKQESHDYFFNVSNQQSNGNKKGPIQKFISDLSLDEKICIRSSVTFLPKTLETRVDSVCKRKKMSVDTPIIDFNDNTETLYGRFQLSREYFIDGKKLPESVRPTFVRIKQRKSFIHQPKEGGVGWRIDMTMAWSGKTREEAEINQKLKNTVYEFECECTGIESIESDIQSGKIYYVVLSMILKIQSFLPSQFKFQKLDSSAANVLN
jgi:hypothetical protein